MIQQRQNRNVYNSIKIRIMMLLLLLCGNSKGQVRHTLTYSNLLFSNMYNKEIDKFMFKKGLPFPAFQYHFLKNKIGVLASTTMYSVNYHPLDIPYLDTNYYHGLRLRSHSLFGTYNIYHNKLLHCSITAGPTYSSLSATRIIKWVGIPGSSEPKVNSDIEKDISASLGLDLKIILPIGISLNTNVWYARRLSNTVNPRNLQLSVGAGYSYLRKRLSKGTQAI
jgi:hypothetical protein